MLVLLLGLASCLLPMPSHGADGGDEDEGSGSLLDLDDFAGQTTSTGAPRTPVATADPCWTLPELLDTFAEVSPAAKHRRCLRPPPHHPHPQHACTCREHRG